MSGHVICNGKLDLYRNETASSRVSETVSETVSPSKLNRTQRPRIVSLVLDLPFLEECSHRGFGRLFVRAIVAYKTIVL
jgi:hypothetical protein